MFKEYTKQVERNIVAKKDELIRELIVNEVGDDKFTLISVADKCKIIIDGFGKETFSFDGKPLAEFYPIETKFDGRKITASFKYMII